MEYQSNSTLSPDLITLKDQIYEKINKAKSVLTCAMFATEFVHDGVAVDNHTLYHALWVVDEYLDELVKIWNVASSRPYKN